MIENGEKYDLLKLVLSIFIVVLHSQILPYKFVPILRIAVPIFFIMSSFFFFKKYDNLKNNFERKKAVRHFTKRNLKLYSFWFIILLPISLLTKDWFSRGIIYGFVKIGHSIFCGSTFAASWFITALIIAVVSICYLTRKISNTTLLIISLFIYAFCLFDTTYYYLFEQFHIFRIIRDSYHNIFGVPYTSFPIALFWVSIGKFIADNKKHIKLSILYGLLFTSCIAFIFEEYIITSYHLAIDNDCYISFIILCPTLFLVFSRYMIPVPKPLLLRKASTIIYCSHLSFLNLLNMAERYYMVPPPKCNFAIIILFEMILVTLIIIFSKKIPLLKYSY